MIRVLDVVRTKFGTLAVVNAVNSRGEVSLTLPPRSAQKGAWYDPKELTRLGSVAELVARLEATQ